MPTTISKAIVPNAANPNLASVQDVVVPDANNPAFTTVTVATQLIQSTADNLVATPGGAQAGTAITAMLSRFITVATAADSAQLGPAFVGYSYTVKNDAAANSMNIFPQTGQSINALANNAAFALAAGKSVEFYCTTAGKWHTLLSA